MRAFARNFSASFLATAIPMLLAGWIVGLLPWPRFQFASFLPALAPLHLAYLVPIALLLYGWRGRNAGIIAGVLGFGAAVYLWLASSLHSQLHVIRDLESIPAPPPAGSERMLILPNARYCDVLCVQVLATGDYQVALPERPAWMIYRRAEGDSCEEKTALRTKLIFVTRGYVGMCASKTKINAMPDGVVIAEYKLAGKGNRSDDIQRDPDDWSIVEHPRENAFAPVGRFARHIPGFIGELYERSVRIDGREQLLERRFRGTLVSAAELLTFSLAPGPIPVGDQFERAAFYGRALGLPLSNAQRPGPAKLETLFDILERELMAAPPDLEVLDDRAIFAVAGAFGGLARHAQIGEAVIVRSHIQRALQSQRAALVDAGLYAMGEPPTADLVEAEAAVGSLLESDNPAIVANALRKASFQFRIRNRPEIRRRVLEIPFRAALFTKESSLTKHGPSSPVAGAADRDEAYRKRAVEYLLSASYLIPGHCDILLSIIARDDEVRKREALATFLATRPSVYAVCAAVSRRAIRNDLFATDELTDRQIAILGDRANLITNGALLRYWRQFLSSERARALSDDHMVGLVQKRLDLAMQSRNRDRREVRTLQFLLKEIAAK